MSTSHAGNNLPTTPADTNMSDAPADTDAFSAPPAERLKLARVKRIAEEILVGIAPAGMFFEKEALELLVELCMEYLALIIQEAADLVNQENRFYITEEFIIKALMNLGYESYVEKCRQAVAQFVEKNNERVKKKEARWAAATGLTQEELLDEQQALFGKAREKYESETSAMEAFKKETSKMDWEE